MANAPLCYFPDGSLATRDTPCKSPSLNGGASPCCAFSDVCLDNHLCLAQDGPELITRGSCTDKYWQSPECSQYCSDGKCKEYKALSQRKHLTRWFYNILVLFTNVANAVNTDNGVAIHPVYVDNQSMFCCQYGDRPGNNTCFVPTKGSISPFAVEAGLVIYNRTSGSTTPINDNDTSTTTVTTTATVTASAFASVSTHPSICTTSTSSSKEGETIGAAVAGLLGLALLIALCLLWRQTRQKQSLRKDVQILEEKYGESMNTRGEAPAGAEYRTPSPDESWDSHQLDGQGHVPYFLAGEVDGASVYEMANNAGRA